MLEMARMIRPNGVLLLVDDDLRLYDEYYRQVRVLDPGQPGFSWTQRIFSAARKAMQARGGDTDANDQVIFCVSLPTAMTLTAFENPYMLQDISNLADRGWMKVWIPIGSWPAGE